MRPIDADALRGELMDAVNAPFLKEMCPANWAEAYESCVRALDRVPTLDYAPVRHGEFERLPEECIPNYRFNPVFCKTCNTTFATINKEGKRCTCCPYCGSKMDGGKNDG